MMGEAFAFDGFFDAAKLYIMPFPCTNVNFTCLYKSGETDLREIVSVKSLTTRKFTPT